MLALMMSTRTWIIVIAGLGVVILLLAALLFGTPAPQLAPALPAAAPSASTSALSAPAQPAASSITPLSSRVSVSSPRSGASVGHSFTVEGKVPGSWSFEAQFPVQVRDPQDNVVGRATGRLQGDWQTTALVPFIAQMQVDATYHGPATLILMKDNPSGLPENDDSVSIPIVVE